MKGGTGADAAAAQASVVAAQASLDSAQKKLDDLKKGPSRSTSGNARASLESAQASVKSAEAKAQVATRTPGRSRPQAVELADQGRRGRRRRRQAKVKAAEAELARGAERTEARRPGLGRGRPWTRRRRTSRAPSPSSTSFGIPTRATSRRRAPRSRAPRRSLRSAETKLAMLQTGPTQADLVAGAGRRRERPQELRGGPGQARCMLRRPAGDRRPRRRGRRSSRHGPAWPAPRRSWTICGPAPSRPSSRAPSPRWRRPSRTSPTPRRNGAKETDLLVAMEQVKIAELNLKQAQLDLQDCDADLADQWHRRGDQRQPRRGGRIRRHQPDTRHGVSTSIFVTLVDPSHGAGGRQRRRGGRGEALSRQAGRGQLRRAAGSAVPWSGRRRSRRAAAARRAWSPTRSRSTSRSRTT